MKPFWQKQSGLVARRERMGYTFVAHWAIGLMIFFIIPLATSFIYAFSNTTSTADGLKLDFAGLTHFDYILNSDANYVKNLTSSLGLIGYTLPIVLALSLILAVVLNQNFAGRTFFRAIFSLPIIIASSPIIEILSGDKVKAPVFNLTGGGEEGVYGGVIDFGSILSGLAFVGYLMTTIVGWPAWLFLAFLLIGFGRGSVSNFDNRMVNQLSGGSPAAANLLHSCFAVGAILTPLVFLALRNAFSWQVGVGYALVLCFISLTNMARMQLKNDRPSPKDKQNSTLIFLKNPSFLILAAMMFCYLCSEYAINGWLVTYIQNKENLLADLAASGSNAVSYSQTMASLLWVVMLIGRLTCAMLSSKVSQKVMMLVSSIGVAIFYALMLNSTTMTMVSFAVAGLGLCMAGICPMIYSDAAIFTNTYPMATSLLLVIGSVGAILMPTIVGSLAESYGFTGGMSAILVTVVLLVVFSLLNVVVKTRKPVIQ